MWSQGLVVVLGVKSSTQLSPGLDVKEVEEPFSMEMCFGPVPELSDGQATDGTTTEKVTPPTGYDPLTDDLWISFPGAKDLTGRCGRVW